MLTGATRAALLVLASALGGCLTPMYGGVAGGALVDEMRAIKVEPIPERLGHYVGNELIFLLNGTGEQYPAKYKLVVNLRQRIQSPVIDSVSGRATSGTVLVDADYSLVPIAGGSPVAQGVAFAAATYDRSSQRFANLRAARDGEIRDAKAIAEQIKTRLAIDLSRRT
jgi:LPS-assembly lipoprotein